MSYGSWAPPANARQSQSRLAPEQYGWRDSSNEIGGTFVREGRVLKDAKWYEKQCEESLKESLRTAAETNEIGQRTAEQLNQQTEQLQKIGQDVDDVSHNLDSSQYLIRGMKSWWGSVVQMFTSPPTRGVPIVSDVPHVGHVPNVGTRQGISSARTTQPVRSAGGSSGSLSKSETPSVVDKDLDLLSEMLVEMHARAVEMGDTIGRHNVDLERIQRGVDINSSRMAKQKRDIDKLLR